MPAGNGSSLDDIETAKDKLQTDKVLKLGFELTALYSREARSRVSCARL